MGEHARQFTGILEMPGLPEVFADGLIVRDTGREVVQIIYTVERDTGTEAVFRVWMPRGAYRVACERCREVVPAH